ncbi:hypothetical protein HD597_003961 [Nonomuraea thailandensis]|uniref:Uncharacterized protein n=1 Tax=Nonomuraea thailandensis TaxID=1188745 RepID=A0A9X2GK42_9ACTN|nr:hypothetical protein [Nonomuraea thailandensis]MCP2356941.1 hypothetical protein [Nonomuraea thailandensis]
MDGRAHGSTSISRCGSLENNAAEAEPVHGHRQQVEYTLGD